MGDKVSHYPRTFLDAIVEVVSGTGVTAAEAEEAGLGEVTMRVA